MTMTATGNQRTAPRHMMFAGSPGPGEAAQLAGYLTDQALDGADIWAADPRRIHLTGLREVRGVTRIETTAPAIAALLGEACAELDTRYGQLTAQPGRVFPPRIVAINDLPLLTELLGPDGAARTRPHLAELLTLGCAVNITMAMTIDHGRLGDAMRIAGGDITAVPAGDGADPAARLLSLLRTALLTGEAHLADGHTGGIPESPGPVARGGWAAAAAGQPRASGPLIGWATLTAAGRRVYLLPDRAVQAAASVSAGLDVPFTWTQQELGGALRESGLLITDNSGGQQRVTVRRQLPGSDRLRVWDLPLSALSSATRS